MSSIVVVPLIHKTTALSLASANAVSLFNHLHEWHEHQLREVGNRGYSRCMYTDCNAEDLLSHLKVLSGAKTPQISKDQQHINKRKMTYKVKT